MRLALPALPGGRARLDAILSFPMPDHPDVR